MLIFSRAIHLNIVGNDLRTNLYMIWYSFSLSFHILLSTIWLFSSSSFLGKMKLGTGLALVLFLLLNCFEVLSVEVTRRSLGNVAIVIT